MDSLELNENCMACMRSSKFHGSIFVTRVYKLYFYNIENEDIDRLKFN